MALQPIATLRDYFESGCQGTFFFISSVGLTSKDTSLRVYRPLEGRPSNDKNFFLQLCRDDTTSAGISVEVSKCNHLEDPVYDPHSQEPTSPSTSRSPSS